MGSPDARRGQVQRPLWASTSVKDPAFADTMYVTELAAPGTVNTMPEATIRATADHAQLHGDAIHGTYDESRRVFEQLETLGVHYDDVVACWSNRVSRSSPPPGTSSWARSSRTWPRWPSHDRWAAW